MPNFPSDGFPPELFADLRIALEADHEDVVDEALKHINVVLKSPSDTEVSRLAKEIESATGCTHRTAVAVIRATASLAVLAAPSDDEEVVPLNVVETAMRKALEKAKEKWTPALAERLKWLGERVREVQEESERALRVGSVTRGVFPMFESVSGTIEMRAAQFPAKLAEQAFKEPLEFIPIASLRLELDSGDPEAIYFQVTDEQLTTLRQAIEELQKAMKAVKDRLQVI